MNQRFTIEPGSLAETMPYVRVQDELRRLIREGRWAIGASLPGRRELARSFGTAVNTINRSITNLVAEGFLQTSDRRGTFVAEALPRSWPANPRPASTATVGILTWTGRGSDLGNWDATVQHALESTFSSLAIRTRLFGTPYDSATGMDVALDAASAAGVGALAVAYFDGPAGWVDTLIRVARAGVPPLMVVTTQNLPFPVSHTAVDEVGAGYAAADHLLHCDYAHVRFLLPFQPPAWLQKRLDGTRQALTLADADVSNLEVGPAACAPSWPAWQALQQSPAAAVLIAEQVDRFIQTVPLGSAGLIVPTDVVAVLVRQALLERGLCPGRDVGLISFDDSPAAASHGLTSLRQPLAEMAGATARALAGALQGHPLPTQVRFLPRLILRGSTQHGPPAKPAGPAGSPAIVRRLRKTKECIHGKHA